MVMTKQELAEFLDSEFDKSIINKAALYEMFIGALDWYDNEPRDINSHDIMNIEDAIASELDDLLTKLESISRK